MVRTLRLKITQRTPSGLLVCEDDWTELNSVIRAWVDIEHLYMSASTNNIIDVSNTSRSFTIAAIDNCTVLGASGEAWGIVVGTGTTAVAITDYALGTLVAHGTGAGQLSHGAVSIGTVPTTSGSKRYFTINRSFTNNTVSNITLDEVGLYIRNTIGSWTFCMERSLKNHTINAGNIATYQYEISATV
jgi:hypothetical protein